MKDLANVDLHKISRDFFQIKLYFSFITSTKILFCVFFCCDTKKLRRFLQNHFTKQKHKKEETSIKLIIEIKFNKNQTNNQKSQKCLI